MNKEKVVEYLKTMKPMHKYLAVTLLLIMVVGISLLFVNEDEYTEIYQNLSDSDKAAILNEMQKLGVDYSENADTGSVSVNKNDAAWVRNKMNELGLPSKVTHGYENFFESSLGTTQSEKELRELASRKGQLERDILGNFANIESVSVQLVMPEDGSIFEIESEGGSASILIKQRGKTKLTNQQVSGLQHMVATAVPGIESSDVKIIDNELGIISLTDEEQEQYENAFEKQLKTVANAEKDVTDKVRNSLTGFFGQENIEVSVNMSINFDEIQSQVETYGDVGTLRSTQKEAELIEKNNGNNEPEAGVEDGGDVTTYENQINENGENYRSESSSVVENYEINKTVENIKKHPELTNTNIVVWVDRTKMREKGLNEKQFADAVALAAGLKVLEDGTYENGQISIMQIDKEAVETIEEKEEVKMGSIERFLQNNTGLVIVIGLILIIAIIVLISLLVKRNKLKKKALEEVELLEEIEGQKNRESIQAIKSELQKMNAGTAYQLEEMTDDEIRELMEEKRNEIINGERDKQLQDMLEKEKNEIKEKKMREVEEQIEKLGGEYPKETAEYLRQLLK